MTLPCQALLLLLGTASSVSAERIDFGDVSGEITALPGLGWMNRGLDFKMYSGYVDVGKNGKTFFWFVESQTPDSASDPVLLWTNGGPGCSGLVGFMTEQGPFRPMPDGSLALNEYSWNTVANMVFIEQPVGVGFSVAADGEIKYGDAQAAQDNYNFVVGFFEKFKMLSKNKFFISSESYGGHYMPTLASALVKGGGVPNFAGFMVGNPLTYMPYRDYGEYGTFAGHNLVPKPLWDQYLQANCSAVPPWEPGQVCISIQKQMENITSGFDAYALDFPKCSEGALAAGRHERWSMRNTIQRAHEYMASEAEARHEFLQQRSRRLVDGGEGAEVEADDLSPYPYFPDPYIPCSSEYASVYLSRADVQAAIHAQPGGPTWTGNWSSCSDAVGNAFSAADTIKPMMPVYADLLASAEPPLKILVYSGDDDSVCATLGTQQWIWNMGLPFKRDPNTGADINWQRWEIDAGPDCHPSVAADKPVGPACVQVGGFKTVWEGLSFVTVHGAGHMVPMTRPLFGLHVLQNFLAGEW